MVVLAPCTGAIDATLAGLAHTHVSFVPTIACLNSMGSSTRSLAANADEGLQPFSSVRSSATFGRSVSERLSGNIAPLCIGQFSHGPQVLWTEFIPRGSADTIVQLPPQGHCPARKVPGAGSVLARKAGDAQCPQHRQDAWFLPGAFGRRLWYRDRFAKLSNQQHVRPARRSRS